MALAVAICALLISSAVGGAAADIGGACCSIVGADAVPCIDNVSVGECLTRRRGVYLGNGVKCDTDKIQMCARLPGACCAAASSQCVEASSFARCARGRFAGVGTRCDACPSAPQTQVHANISAPTRADDGNVRRLIVSGKLYDRERRSTHVTHATVALMSREHVQLATTRVDSHAEYAIEVNASHYAAIVSEEHAPFRVVVSDNALYDDARERCYRSKRHAPRRVDLAQVPAIRDVPVVCDKLAANATTAKRDASMRESFAMNNNKISLSSVIFFFGLLATIVALVALCFCFCCL